MRRPIEQQCAIRVHEQISTNAVDQPAEDDLGGFPAQQVTPWNRGRFIVGSPEQLQATQAQEHIQADLIQPQRQCNQERRHQPLHATPRVTKGDGVDHRHQAQGRGGTVVLIGQVLQEERAVPERQQHQATSDAWLVKVMERQAGQRRRHGQRGDQQGQGKDVWRGMAEGQRVVEQLGEESALLGPGHARRQRTPVVIDVGIIREDQRQDIHQGGEQKKPPDLMPAELANEEVAEPAHANACPGLYRRRCP
ncbi:hypothetical protein D3C86_1407740 [compost metagenome]